MAARASATVADDTLWLAGVIDYDSVLPLDQQGRQWLRSAATSCHVDLEKITYSGSAGLALLLGWLRLAQELNKSLMILNLPSSMTALAKVYGLEDILSNTLVPNELPDFLVQD